MDQPVCSKPNASYATLSDMPIGWGSSSLYFTTIYISSRHYFRRFFPLGICCAFTGLYPAYIAGTVWRTTFACHLYIAKSTSTILGSLLEKATEFTIGSFEFQFRSNRAFERHADFSAYDISYEDVTLNFSSGPCRRNGGLRSSGMLKFRGILLGQH